MKRSDYRIKSRWIPVHVWAETLPASIVHPVGRVREELGAVKMHDGGILWTLCVFFNNDRFDETSLFHNDEDDDDDEGSSGFFYFHPSNVWAFLLEN